eukprot:scaffold1446_cov175-Ochromonas_danica.AAC.16
MGDRTEEECEAVGSEEIPCEVHRKKKKRPRRARAEGHNQIPGEEGDALVTLATANPAPRQKRTIAPSHSHVVSSPLELGTTHLILSWDSAREVYTLSPENNKNPRVLLLPPQMLEEEAQGSSPDNIARVQKDALYGEQSLLEGKSADERFAQQASMLQLETSLQHLLNTHLPRHTLRIVGGVEERHGFRNSLICLVDRMQDLRGWVESYKGLEDATALSIVPPLNRRRKPEEQKSSAEDEDRVHALLAVPLEKMASLSYDDFVTYLRDSLKERGWLLREKVHVHFHIQYVLWPGINRLWRKLSVASASQSPTDENLSAATPLPSHSSVDGNLSTENMESAGNRDSGLDFLGDLARAPISENDGVGIVFSVCVGRSRVILDLPGGKRMLGETSLECAIRETKEEIGLDLYGAHINGQPPSPSSEWNWSIVQHHVYHTMSCFVAYGRGLWLALHQ